VAKEFKDFDKKYAHLAGTAIKTIVKEGGHIARGDFDECDHWPWMKHFTEEYSISTIRFAVYEAPGAEEWQQFRVSLKGLTTREKIYALLWYWEIHVAPGAGASISVEAWSREIIRVNNYLGALKRGGQLGSTLRVVKG
jgi:hypothetical protein